MSHNRFQNSRISYYSEHDAYNYNKKEIEYNNNYIQSLRNKNYDNEYDSEITMTQKYNKCLNRDIYEYESKKKNGEFQREAETIRYKQSYEDRMAREYSKQQAFENGAAEENVLTQFKGKKQRSGIYVSAVDVRKNEFTKIAKLYNSRNNEVNHISDSLIDLYKTDIQTYDENLHCTYWCRQPLRPYKTGWVRSDIMASKKTLQRHQRSQTFDKQSNTYRSAVKSLFLLPSEGAFDILDKIYTSQLVLLETSRRAITQESLSRSLAELVIMTMIRLAFGSTNTTVFTEMMKMYARCKMYENAVILEQLTHNSPVFIYMTIMIIVMTERVCEYVLNGINTIYADSDESAEYTTALIYRIICIEISPILVEMLSQTDILEPNECLQFRISLMEWCAVYTSVLYGNRSRERLTATKLDRVLPDEFMRSYKFICCHLEMHEVKNFSLVGFLKGGLWAEFVQRKFTRIESSKFNDRIVLASSFINIFVFNNTVTPHIQAQLLKIKWTSKETKDWPQLSLLYEDTSLEMFTSHIKSLYNFVHETDEFNFKEEDNLKMRYNKLMKLKCKIGLGTPILYALKNKEKIKESLDIINTVGGMDKAEIERLDRIHKSFCKECGDCIDSCMCEIDECAAEIAAWRQFGKTNK